MAPAERKGRGRPPGAKNKTTAPEPKSETENKGASPELIYAEIGRLVENGDAAGLRRLRDLHCGPDATLPEVLINGISRACSEAISKAEMRAADIAAQQDSEIRVDPEDYPDAEPGEFDEVG